MAKIVRGGNAPTQRGHYSILPFSVREARLEDRLGLFELFGLADEKNDVPDMEVIRCSKT